MLIQKYNLVEETIDFNPKEQIAHTHLHFDDIFSSEEYEYLR